MRSLRWLFFPLVILLASQAVAGSWSVVGGDPFVGNARQAISSMRTITSEQRHEAIYRFETGKVECGVMPKIDPRTGRPQVANEMVYGHFRMMRPTVFAWTNRTEVGVQFVSFGSRKIVHVDQCNNWLVGDLFVRVPPPKVVTKTRTIERIVERRVEVPRPYPVYKYQTVCLPGKVVKETRTFYIEPPHWTPAPTFTTGGPTTTTPGTFGLWWQPSLHKEAPEVCPGSNPPPLPVYPPPCDP